MQHDITILTEADLRSCVALDLDALKVVEDAFAALATGKVVMPPILSMAIPEAHGEVDVKTAYIPGFDGFAIKVSPGFFDNPKLGLPSLNGLMILFSATTGLVQALLLDNGYLTDIRTAAAGAVAARHLAPSTVETAGVLGPAVGVVASLQAIEALKLLSGNRAAVNPRMTLLDLWTNNIRNVKVANSRTGDCRACARRDFAYLEARRGDATTTLCGRNSVQIAPAAETSVDLSELARKLQSAGRVTANPYLLRLEVETYRITVFADGRAIIAGTDDPATARTVHARYLGG